MYLLEAWQLIDPLIVLAPVFVFFLVDDLVVRVLIEFVLVGDPVAVIGVIAYETRQACLVVRSFAAEFGNGQVQVVNELIKNVFYFVLNTDHAHVHADAKFSQLAFTNCLNYYENMRIKNVSNRYLPSFDRLI